MGRSRAVPHSADDDLGQSRSKRKRASSNVENLETATTVQGIVEGKKASYHCNYCNKDFSGKIRIKCVVCSDFDLCVECFSVGGEVHPHKSNHPYRVMDNLSFPLICADWNADEEILLLEGIEMYGLGNWAEVAEHVGTKSRLQCIDHYNTIYMNSPCFPLPDMSHVMGKNREELLAMAREHGEAKKGSSAPLVEDVKEEPPFSVRIKVEDHNKKGPAGRSSSSLTSEFATVPGPGGSNTLTGGAKMASTVTQSKDGRDEVKLEDSYADRSVGEKKPRTSGDEGPSMTEFSGYNSKRQEFEIEYDNDAEQLLADMEFKESDTDAERELKLRVLRIYSKSKQGNHWIYYTCEELVYVIIEELHQLLFNPQMIYSMMDEAQALSPSIIPLTTLPKDENMLDERKRRKDFILERNLLHPDPHGKQLSSEEKELCNPYRVFMRFHSKEEHENLLQSLIDEHRILKRIQDLQEARAAGCRTSAEAERYIEQKRKTEAEESACRMKESTPAGPSGKFLQRANHLKDLDSSPRGVIRGTTVLDSGLIDPLSVTTGLTVSNTFDIWDVTGFLGAELLTDAERQLCGELRILPTYYLNMQETMSIAILSGNITKKSDAYSLFNVDPSKVDKVYDILMQKGLTQT